MSRNVIKIEANKHVSDAARLMAEKGVGCVIVTSGSKTVGIITEKDLVRKVLAKSLEMTKVSVIDVMSTPLFTISSEQMLDQAAKLMVEYKVRRLPVVDDGILVGIITANDLARTLANEVRGEELTLKAIARIGRVVESSPILKKGLYVKRTLEQTFQRKSFFSGGS